MAKIEFIGNLGADAQVKDVNGNKFISFNVADTETYTDSNGQKQERTQWISCTMNGDGGKLLQYLVKGKTVYVRGYLSTRIFDSAQFHCKMVGLNCSVREIELIAGNSRDVPRELHDSNGVVFQVNQAFYIDPQRSCEGLLLIDRQGNKYTANKQGWVTKQQAAPQQPADDPFKQYQGDNAKTF